MKNKIAIPLEGGVLCRHFGHCEQFYIVETGEEGITGEEKVTPPEHQPGLYPEWLSGLGVNAVIASGMGERAISLFQAKGIPVYEGDADDPKQLVEEFVKGNRKSLEKGCGHSGEHCSH
ncbi:MAG: NifB/NifX family molybdenum-iron cluster-binding protein [Bacteroidales bacterium]|jgi:predicted Fe-Mo cluster-binding NifX family protein|nr:NifB/NifX family molybdenum-iron cluster-binding protein [Bacteroidales bacterium]MCI2146098.1 NifB/NifX family molybdenum-iron cluster-binding protein [Bacteroidales bacterium]